MVVPDANFVQLSNQEGTQQNLIDSGLEVFWLRLGGTSIAFSSLEICSAISCWRDGMPARPRPAKGSKARGPSNPDLLRECPYPVAHSSQGYPQPSVHDAHLCTPPASGGTKTGASAGLLPSKRAQLGCYSSTQLRLTSLLGRSSSPARVAPRFNCSYYRSRLLGNRRIKRGNVDRTDEQKRWRDRA